jgi:hypothetical protein
MCEICSNWSTKTLCHQAAESRPLHGVAAHVETEFTTAVRMRGMSIRRGIKVTSHGQRSR